MGCCQRKPVPIKEPNLITYNKMLISISNKHPEFDLRLVGIMYSKEGSILLKVENRKEKKLFYLEQTQIKNNEDINMILKQIQLCIEMTDGFLLSYHTSFATNYGAFIIIIYDYIELISLEKMISDENFQEQRMEINQKVQFQLFSIFYLLNRQDLSINNLMIDNIFIYQKNGQINIKLINITLIEKIKDNQISSQCTLEKNETESLLVIFQQLKKRNIEKQNDTQQLDAIINDLKKGKYQFPAVQDDYKVYEKQYTLIKIQDIQTRVQDKQNLNWFLLELNQQIRNQQLNNQVIQQNHQQNEIDQNQQI